ncbi:MULTISPECIES: AAA family ATPase [Corynebacterium]|uniref:AAA family ATPase n=1 Tax=Corynebacterium belfantii TaxID=2014537 RepID=A0ABS0LD29_9CORY|nr:MULTISPECIES: AAA family ATPase [Corynebacterium]MBG9330397.1 AAA family ATPase [Corynebacterium belfantii]MBG9346291.1 AAA family ATPase [Corynebacterium belfantii]MBG9354107.1 AAA family ATPase [Corynebacterium belfantii]
MHNAPNRDSGITSNDWTSEQIEQLLKDTYPIGTTAKQHLEGLTGDLNEWIYQDWLCDSYTLIVGKAKQGKSLLAVNLASVFTQQSSFLGSELIGSDRSRRVLIITTEANGIKENIRRLEALGADLDLVAIERYCSTRQLEQAYKAAELGALGLVIVDNLKGVCRGVDLKDDASVDHLTEVIEPFNLAGVPVVVLHHANKSSSQPLASVMGSETITGLFRHIIHVQRTKDGTRLRAQGNLSEAEITIRFNELGAIVTDAEQPSVSAKPEHDPVLNRIAELAIQSDSGKSKSQIARDIAQTLIKENLLSTRGEPFSENTIRNKLKGLVDSKQSSLEYSKANGFHNRPTSCLN